MELRRLFPESQIPAQGERIETLLESGKLRIERILSAPGSAPGSASGPYDQEQDEWVLLLQGRALLEVEGERVELTAGEALWLPAHRVHSVVDTSDDPPCIWLAVHLP